MSEHTQTNEKMEKTKNKTEKKTKLASADVACTDKKCHIHGRLKARGKTFEGTVVSKFPKRVAIEFERTVYVKKYERYKKSKTKVHARLPDCMKQEINVGDYIKVRECRPVSKIIHFAVIEKVKNLKDHPSVVGLEEKK